MQKWRKAVRKSGWLGVAVAFSCAVMTAHGDLVTSAGVGEWEMASTWNPGVPQSGDDVTIRAGDTVTMTGTVAKTIQSLVLAGALSHAYNGTVDQSFRVLLTVAGGASITTGGKIDVTGKGYARGDTVHVAGYGPAGGGGMNGGGHGGEGGVNAGSDAGVIYGDVLEPTTLGSGGGCNLSWSAVGGYGAGAVKLVVVGTLSLNGSILADGTAGAGAKYGGGGGGAGGSVWIDAGTLTGTGLVRANGGLGGAGGYGSAAGGGGGRISVNYGASSFSGVLAAYGGNGWNKRGGAGPVYVKSHAGSATLTLDNDATVMTGTPGTWTDNSVLNGLVSLTIRDCGVLKHAVETAMDASISTVTLNRYGRISVLGKGHGRGTVAHPNGYGAGGGSTGNAAGGGGYGGVGGSDAGAGGPTYGSETEPTDYGSGGGCNVSWSAPGGAGGGAVKLTIGTLTCEGSITADGAAGSGAKYGGGGGGSGGSIWLDVRTLSGTGLIQAGGGNGGSGGYGSAAGGGGGRIAVYYRTEEFSGLLTAPGGTGWSVPEKGDDGTVIFEPSAPPGTIVLFR